MLNNYFYNNQTKSIQNGFCQTEILKYFRLLLLLRFFFVRDEKLLVNLEQNVEI